MDEQSRRKTERYALTIRAILGVLAVIWLSSAARGESLEELTNQGLIEISAGSTDGVSLRIAEDLATVLDSRGTRRVLPVVGKGSLQNLTDLFALRGIDIAFVQLDVLDYARAHKLLPKIESLSYLAKLYPAEFHLLALSSIGAINDLTGKQVNVGSLEDGSTVTGGGIFKRLGVEIEATHYNSAVALEKLQAGEIAAMFYVGGKPAPLFTALKASHGLKFLNIPLSCHFAGCAPAQLTPQDYPELVIDPVTTLSVPIVMLVAPLARDSERYRNVASFTDSFFTRFPDLLDAPHLRKWREVDLTADLPGWRRFGPAEAWLRRNVSASVVLNERQLRQIFEQFLDERSRIAGNPPLSGEEKNLLFEQFREWERGKTQTGSSVPR